MRLSGWQVIAAAHVHQNLLECFQPFRMVIYNKATLL